MLAVASPARRAARSSIGPLSIHAYGLMIALGVVAAVWLAGRRLEQAGIGTREDMSAIAVWAVLAGVIGARLYHVITDCRAVPGRPRRIVQDLEGRPRHPRRAPRRDRRRAVRRQARGASRRRRWLDCAAPAMPLAQAIGRWGNWFNQELFGRPTTLPWALRDRRRAPARPATRRARRSTRRSCTSRCGTWRSCGVLLLDRPAVKLRPGRLMACTCSATASAGSGSRACASTPPTPAAGCASTSGSSLVAGVGAAVLPRRRLAAPPPTSPSRNREPVERSTLPRMSDDRRSPRPVRRRDPGIALLTLNRPERLNAWNGELGARYFELLDQASRRSGGQGDRRHRRRPRLLRRRRHGHAAGHRQQRRRRGRRRGGRRPRRSTRPPRCPSR